jgi:CRP/FNR family transcriptional regulator, anaerobic regulatory protein
MENVTRCGGCTIRHKAICAALSADGMAGFNRMARRRTLPAGAVILGEGEANSMFANVVSGVVKLTKTLDDGRQHIIGLLFASDFLGRAFRKDNPYFAEAATQVEICSFPAAGFEKMLPAMPDLQHRLFLYTLGELDACQEWMLLLARKRAEERVASFLLMVAKRVRDAGLPAAGSDGAIRFQLPLSRAEISDCLGLTLETVSRQMTRLKNKGVIELANYREIVIPDMNALQLAAYDS